jgi:hypothetical protein
LLREATQALHRIFDRIDPFLKDDLLGNMLELLLGQPAPMGQRLMAASAVNPAVTQQEGKHLLAFATKIRARASRARTRSRTAHETRRAPKRSSARRPDAAAPA